MRDRLREAFVGAKSNRGWAFWVVMFLTLLLLPLPVAVPLIASRLVRSRVAAPHRSVITVDEQIAPSESPAAADLSTPPVGML